MNSKVLVIGVGGLGSEIVSGVERITEPSKQRGIRFVIMDTDVNTINRIKREGFRGRVVQLSDNMTVGEYLDSNPEARKDWFLNNDILMNKPMTEGAGQVRAISRLAFELAERKGKLFPIEEALGELFMQSGHEALGAVRILVVSSLAGGTGSGSVIPLSIYLRKTLERRYGRRDVIIRGMFLTADCFFSIVNNEYERRSLAGNAYAAIKELDAFMRSADGYLPHYYNGIILDESSRKSLSYNYCYLFSSKDQTGAGEIPIRLVKKYMIQCIYTQILSPMQELNNSIEDNVLKSTMTAKKKRAEFKRYCAAGIHVLNYPYDEIMEYLSLHSLINFFSDDWIVIDRAYGEEKARQRERAEEGRYVEGLDLGDFAVQYIMTTASTEQAIEHIRRETILEQAGREKPLWTAYMEALKENISTLAARAMEDCRGHYNAVEDILKRFSIRQKRTKNSIEALVDTFDNLFAKWEDSLNGITDSSVQRYFDNQYQGRYEPYHIEYWIQNKYGFIHLSSVRYFLYQVIQTMVNDLETVKQSNQSMADALRYAKYKIVGQRRAGRDSKIFEDVQEDAYLDGLRHISNDWRWNLFNRDINPIVLQYKKNLEQLSTYCYNRLYEQILEAGIAYLKALVGNIEVFYREFYYNRNLYINRRESLIAEFNHEEMDVVEYVGTDERYMDYLTNQMSDIETEKKMSGIFFRQLYFDIKNMEVPANIRKERHVEDLFQTTMLTQWRKILEKEHGNLLDIGIIDALLQEGRLSYGNGQEIDYLQDKLQAGWDKTVPRLLIGNGEKGELRNFCLYHNSVLNRRGRAEQVIHTKLVQRGGAVSNEEEDRYSLTFYKVVYNLNAADIDEYAVGKPEIEADRGSGYGFKSYYEIISLQNSTKLSPHIDKRWSNVFMMPDVNYEYTGIRIKMIYKAAFLQWQGSNIKEEVDVHDKQYYHYYYKSREKSVRCGLKQIISLLADDTQEVEHIHADIEERLHQGQMDGLSLKESCFGILMLRRAEIQGGVFRLPYELLNQEAERLWEDDLISYMMEAVLDELHDMITRFCDANETQIVLTHIISEHLEYLQKNRAGKRCFDEVRRYAQKRKWYRIDEAVLLLEDNGGRTDQAW